MADTPEIQTEPTTFQSWSQTKSIYYTINHNWELLNFNSMIRVGKDEIISDNNEANSLLINRAHPCLRSNDLYSPGKPDIRFYLELYPRGHARNGRFQLYLTYKQGGPKRAKVYITSTLLDADNDEMKCNTLKWVMKPGLRKKVYKVKNFTNMGYVDADLSKPTLKIELRVFVGTDYLVSLNYLPMSPLQRHQLEILHRGQVVSDLVNFLEREVDTQVEPKIILDNGYKVILGALLPLAAQSIHDNFDNFYESSLGGVNAKTLKELFAFLFSGEIPVGKNTKLLETAARKLNIVSLLDEIEKQRKLKSAQPKQKGMRKKDKGHKAKRQKTMEQTNNDKVNNTGHGDQAQVVGPSRLEGSSNEVAGPSRTPARSTRCKHSYREQKARPPDRPVYEEFTLTHVWGTNCVMTDPTKRTIIESPKFFSPALPNVKFHLRIIFQIYSDKVDFACIVQVQGFKEVTVECRFTAKDSHHEDLKSLAITRTTKRLVKNTERHYFENFLNKKHCTNLHKVHSFENAVDDLYIHCKIKVKTHEPRPVVEEHLCKTYFNAAKLAQTLKTMLESGACANFELRAGEKRDVFCAHRAILFARSKHFRDMYNDPVKGGGDLSSAEYPALGPQVMSDVLQHIYTGESPPAERMTIQLCQASLKFKLNALHSECVNELADNLTMDSIVSTLEAANKFKDEKLLHKCFDYRLNHLETIREEVPGWEKYTLDNTDLMTDYMNYVMGKKMLTKKS